MLLFRSERKNIFVVNNEFVNCANIYANRWSKRPENADDVRKGKAAHGISIFEIETKFGDGRLPKTPPTTVALPLILLWTSADRLGVTFC
ncbi:MAG: hypothetical protein ACPGQV_16995 [Alphaproteobacteria bacterium]